jgi:hypothetical protein
MFWGLFSFFWMESKHGAWGVSQRRQLKKVPHPKMNEDCARGGNTVFLFRTLFNALFSENDFLMSIEKYILSTHAISAFIGRNSPLDG